MKFFLLFFFFSSRRRHTRSLRDWSSDVCSSDLFDRLFLRIDSAGEQRECEKSLSGVRPCSHSSLPSARVSLVSQVSGRYSVCQLTLAQADKVTVPAENCSCLTMEQFDVSRGN